MSLLPEPTAFALFLLAAVSLILTPGPDTLFVLSRAVESRAVGVRAALGVAAGVCLHTLLAALGLAVVYRTVPGAARAVRLVGGAYLVYLGARTLRETGVSVGGGDGEAGGGAGDGATSGLGADDPPSGGFRSGFLVNASNPQVALFFLAFLPGFAAGPAAEAQMLLLGATYAAVTAVYLSGVAVAADAAAGVVRSTAAQRRLNRAAGVVLVALGLWVATGGM